MIFLVFISHTVENPLFTLCTLSLAAKLSQVSFRAVHAEVKVRMGLRSYCVPPFWQLKAQLHIERRWSQVSSDHLVEGEKTISDEIVFTVCWKLITRNKLISRYGLRINCIFTEVTGSDGSSSSDKSGHTKWSIGLHGLSVPLLYIRMHLIILTEIISTTRWLSF